MIFLPILHWLYVISNKKCFSVFVVTPITNAFNSLIISE